MKDQFEKNLQLLKKRPERYLVDVKVKDRQYELEVYLDTTLEKIMNRYKKNGFYEENEEVTQILVDEKQTNKLTKIEDLIKNGQKQKKQISNIKIQLIHHPKIEHSAKDQNKSLLQHSEVKVYQSRELQNPKQDKNISQYKAESGISVKQLEVLIDSKQNKLQIQQRFKKYSELIDKYTVNLNSKNIANQKTIMNLKNFINLLGHKIQLFHKNGNVSAFSMAGSKIMDQNSKKQITLDRSQKKIIQQLELIMKPKENDTISQQLLSYLKQIRGIIKSKSRGQKLALFGKEYESVNSMVKKINEQIVNDFQQLQNSKNKQIQNLNKQINSLNDKMKVLQKKLQKPKIFQQGSEGVKLRTSFINNLQHQKQMNFLKEEIQKYEEHSIDCLETVMEFNKCQIINFQTIVNLLDEYYFSPFTRILMIIGVQNQSFLIYSTKGIFREGSSLKINQTGKGNPQTSCFSGAGFLILGKQYKKYENSNGKLVSSLIKYNKKILSIGNRLNLLYSAKKKIQMIYKSSTEICQLEDNTNELQNALKNKKLEVLSIQIYKVVINYKNMCEASLTASTEATMSIY